VRRERRERRGDGGEERNSHAAILITGFIAVSGAIAYSAKSMRS
jgi:hypothetical protein